MIQLANQLVEAVQGPLSSSAGSPARAGTRTEKKRRQSAIIFLNLRKESQSPMPYDEAVSWRENPAGAGSRRPAHFEFATEDKPNSERWEPCLRRQIVAHPRLSLATGIALGLLLGWWVKRLDTPPDPHIMSNLGNFGADLVSLAELQLELLGVDGGEAIKHARVPAFVMFLAIGFVIGSCPLAMLGLSWWLANITVLTVAQAALIVAFGGLILAAILFFIAWKGLRVGAAALNRSREEFRNNLQWIKHILKHPRPHQPRRP